MKNYGLGEDSSSIECTYDPHHPVCSSTSTLSLIAQPSSSCSGGYYVPALLSSSACQRRSRFMMKLYQRTKGGSTRDREHTGFQDSWSARGQEGAEEAVCTSALSRSCLPRYARRISGPGFAQLVCLCSGPGVLTQPRFSCSCCLQVSRESIWTGRTGFLT